MTEIEEDDGHDDQQSGARANASSSKTTNALEDTNHATSESIEEEKKEKELSRLLIPKDVTTNDVMNKKQNHTYSENKLIPAKDSEFSIGGFRRETVTLN